jgi:RTX calcium-binding nonapeptide repeat (4 copies)
LSTLSVSGGSHNITVYGNGAVFAGNGNDTIDVHGVGKIQVGSGNDSVTDNSNGQISVGGGSDTISLSGNGVINETGYGGHDTINLGFGSDTIIEQGQATIYGEFGSATMSGGELSIANAGWSMHELTALTGNATLIGGEYTNQFVGGTGSVVMKGSGLLGPDTFVGGSGHDTMTGGANNNLFEFLSNEKGGQHLITNFVAGQDQLYLEGQSLSYLQQNHDISTSGGNTFIKLDGGATTVELKGITSLSNTDITTHK